MNSYERIMHTIQGKDVDRPPVISVLSLYAAKLLNIDVKTLLSDSKTYVDGQVTLQKEFALDNLLLPFNYSAIGEMFNCNIHWLENAAPNIKKCPVSSIDELLKSTIPDIHSVKRMQTIIDSCKTLHELYKNTVPVFGALPGPSGLLALILGMEAWMELFLFNESSLDEAFHFIEPLFVKWGNTLFESGATALMITEPMASMEMCTRELFEEKILPVLENMLSKLNGPIVFHHSGGRIGHILDLVQTLPNVIGISVGFRDNLADARKELGSKLLIGNIDNIALASGNESNIYNKALECLKTGGKNGHFILANSGADIPMNTPPENIKALKKACIDFAAKKEIVQ
jgi:uroporphyrinogen decarboxylase